MAYFDYTPQKSALDFNEGLSSLGDALTDVLNRRQKQRQADAELAFKQQDEERKNKQTDASIAYYKSIADRGERRDALTFGAQQAERESNAKIAASKALAEGNPELANVIMSGAKTFDPMTGEPTGQGQVVAGPARDVGPAPVAPVAPQAPQPVPPEIAARRRGRTNTSEDEGAGFYRSQGRPMPPQTGVDPLHPEPPVFTDDGKPPNPAMFRDFSPSAQAARYQDTGDALAEQQARLDAQKYSVAKQDFDHLAADYPAAKAEYEADRRTAENERPYTLRFGANDPGVQVTPQAQRYAHRQQAADDFAQTVAAMPNLSDRDRDAAALAHQAILAGEDPKQVFKQFNLERSTGQNQTFKHGENQFHEQEADKRTALMANAKGSFADPKVMQAHEAQARGTANDINSLNRSIDGFATKFGEVTKEHRAWTRLDSALANLDSNNAVQQHEGASALVGFFRGGNMVTSDAYKNILGNISGMGGRLDQAIESISSGRYSDENAAILRQAAHEAVNQYKTQLRALQDGAVNAFGPGSGYENYAGNVNARIGGLFKTLGMPVPPIYPDDPSAVRLGERVRPYMTPPKKRPPGAPPETRAKDKANHAKSLDDAMQ